MDTEKVVARVKARLSLYEADVGELQAGFDPRSSVDCALAELAVALGNVTCQAAVQLDSGSLQWTPSPDEDPESQAFYDVLSVSSSCLQRWKQLTDCLLEMILQIEIAGARVPGAKQLRESVGLASKVEQSSLLALRRQTSQE